MPMSFLRAKPIGVMQMLDQGSRMTSSLLYMRTTQSSGASMTYQSSQSTALQRSGGIGCFCCSLCPLVEQHFRLAMILQVL